MKLRKRTLRFVADKNNDVRSDDGRKRSAPRLRRRASEVMNYRLFRKFILIGVSIGMAFLLMGYSFVLLYDRTGRFSVAIGNPSDTFVITLSEEPEFRIKSSRLVYDQQVKITNMTGNDIPPNVDGVYGQHNGENYLAYTFFCKNVGTATAAIHYEINFNNVSSQGMDEAVRVRLYVDGKKTDYAKTKSGKDGTVGKEDYFCDSVFAGKNLVCRKVIDEVAPQQYVRFTVVIWIEGDDKDCENSIIGGTMKFDMNIEATGVETV